MERWENLRLMNCLFEFDKKFENIVIGTDEAGRGPGAGGVFAAAVCFRENFLDILNKDERKILSKLNDSKKISEKLRLELFPVIKKCAFFSIQCIEIDVIEKINILNSSLFAMKMALDEVVCELKTKKPTIALVDGNRRVKNYNGEFKLITKGDSKSASIAASSVLAKVERDLYMQNLHKIHPQYNWQKNKGYLTKEHIEAIKTYGVSKFHRKSFLKKITGGIK